MFKWFNIDAKHDIDIPDEIIIPQTLHINLCMNILINQVWCGLELQYPFVFAQ